MHVRLEVSGTQARVFLGAADEPALRIHNLQRGASRGGLGLSGPKDGSAWFSNFTYHSDHSLRFDSPPALDIPTGMLREWQVSTPFRARLVDRQHALEGQSLPDSQWRTVTAAPSGLVDIAREFGRSAPEPECVLAKAVVRAESDEVRRVRFGYSDEVTILLNDRPLFSGNSAYRSRDPSFLGIIGLFDSVYLPLKKGDNQLLLMVTERMGGWGFLVQDTTAVQ